MMSRCYHGSMRTKKERMATTFRAESLDREALDAIKGYYGLVSDNQAISYALREIARQVQSKMRREAGKDGSAAAHDNSSPA